MLLSPRAGVPPYWDRCQCTAIVSLWQLLLEAGVGGALSGEPAACLKFGLT